MKLSHISRKMNRKGFTLIELLIVIGILGILAAGLLSALDPLDQLRRGRDSTRRTVAVELVGALNRYYAQTGTWPWGTGTIGVTPHTAGVAVTTIGTLTAANELKQSFATGIPTGRDLFFYSDSVGSSVFACFRQEANGPNAADVYTNGTANPPTTGAACSGGSGGTTCWFCAR